MKMSRAYKLEVETIGITEEQLNKVLKEQFRWEGETYSCEVRTFFSGEGCLCGGQSEIDAHNEIYQALKQINPNAKIKTEWTYLDQLPYEVYGDDIE